MCSYRQLLLWQQAASLTCHIYHATEGLETDDHFELAGRLRRESLAVAVHIASDYSSDATEFLQGLQRARRALICLEHLICVAQYVEYWPVSRTVTFARRLLHIRRHFQAFFRSLAGPDQVF